MTKSFLERFKFVLKYPSFTCNASLGKTWTTGFCCLFASIKIKSLLLWMIFHQEPKLVSNLMEGHFSTNWNTSKNEWFVGFLLQIFFLKCPTLGNTSNIIILYHLKNSCIITYYFSTVASKNLVARCSCEWWEM